MVAGEGVAVAVDDEDSEGAVEEDGTRGVAEREAALLAALLLGPGFLDEDECWFPLLPLSVLLVMFRSREAKRRSSSSRSPASEQKVM